MIMLLAASYYIHFNGTDRLKQGVFAIDKWLDPTLIRRIVRDGRLLTGATNKFLS